MLVVDANVVAYLLVAGEKTEQARELWEKDRDWHAPRLLYYELANVFTRLVKQAVTTPAEGRAGLESALGLVRLLDTDPSPARILEIASRLEISGYDACYLGAAEMLRAPLVTEDIRLLRAAPGVARPLESFRPS